VRATDTTDEIHVHGTGTQIAKLAVEP